MSFFLIFCFAFVRLKDFFEATGESKETFFQFRGEKIETKSERCGVEKFFYIDALQRFNRRARAEVPTVKQPRKRHYV